MIIRMQKWIFNTIILVLFVDIYLFSGSPYTSTYSASKHALHVCIPQKNNQMFLYCCECVANVSDDSFKEKFITHGPLIFYAWYLTEIAFNISLIPNLHIDFQEMNMCTTTHLKRLAWQLACMMPDFCFKQTQAQCSWIFNWKVIFQAPRFYPSV